MERVKQIRLIVVVVVVIEIVVCIVAGGHSPVQAQLDGAAEEVVVQRPSAAMSPRYALGIGSFSGAGAQIRTNLSQGIAYSGVTGLRTLADDRLIAVTQNCNLGYSMPLSCGLSRLFRLSKDGQLDPSFGDHGSALTAFSNVSQGLLQVQANEGILVAGVYSQSLAVQRFDPEGHSDPHFGDHGIAAIVPLTPLLKTTAYGIEVQPDGKILLLGWATDIEQGEWAPWKFVLRFSVNGQLDPTFGENGLIQIGTIGHDAQIKRLKPESEGKFIVATETSVWCFNASGQLDTQFAASGIYTPTEVTGTLHYFNAMPREDGGVDYVQYSQGTDVYRLKVMRLNQLGVLQGVVDLAVTDGIFPNVSYIIPLANGVLQIGSEFTDISFRHTEVFVVRRDQQWNQDVAFGVQGIFTSAVHLEGVRAAALQSDGSIVLGSYNDAEWGVGGSALTRLTPDGHLDTHFGNSGFAIWPQFTGSYDYLVNTLYQADGKLLALGHSYIERSVGLYHVRRYNADGLPDLGYGQAGQVTLSETLRMGERVDTPMHVQADGKLLIAPNRAEFSTELRSRDNSFFLVRLNNDGSTDLGFGTNGWITSTLQTPVTDVEVYNHVTQILEQPDHKILVAVAASQALTSGMTSQLDPTFGVSGVLVTPNSISVALDPQGQIYVFGGGGYTIYDLVRRQPYLARYTRDGAFDAAFGQGGLVSLPVDWQPTGTHFSAVLEAHKLIIRKDGRVLMLIDVFDCVVRLGCLLKQFYFFQLTPQMQFDSGTEWVTPLRSVKDLYELHDGSLLVVGGDGACGWYYYDYCAGYTNSPRISVISPDLVTDEPFCPSPYCGSKAPSQIFAVNPANEREFVIGGEALLPNSAQSAGAPLDNDLIFTKYRMVATSTLTQTQVLPVILR